MDKVVHKNALRNAQIAGALRTYLRGKSELKARRAEMVRVAVTHCGLPQEEALQMDLCAFLDGFLAGQGVQPTSRSGVTT